ncbi:MAG: glycosyltransferase family 2 protein [Nitrososphaerota archaeon]|jgi:GT2 family glycosyltransferase|nr:glycosyltransferase family 2 protein [Nitrososphaerota archaeon]MDG6936881.1 glycosyltransferase family 2 protein [Nitrososphaerota archaeon]MDG6944872.1 glycosyltransferase family 2 protein [Nitrososphaerota archaeon]
MDQEKTKELYGLSVLVITFNSEETIIPLLDSIYKYLADNVDEVLIIDNNSADRTCQLLESYGKVKLIKNSENVGFRKALNRGLLLARNNLVLVLNPDARLGDGLLVNCCRAMINEPNAAYCFPRLIGSGNYEYEYFNDEAIPFLIQYPPYRRKKMPNRCVEAEVAGGAVFIIKKEAALKVGGYDEGVFMYYEEYEISLKLRNAGYKILFCPTAVCYHEGAHSIKKSHRDLAERLLFVYSEMFFSAIYLFYKYCKMQNKGLKHYIWHFLLILTAIEISFYYKNSMPLRGYFVAIKKSKSIKNSSTGISLKCKWDILKYLKYNLITIERAIRGMHY